MKSRYGPVLVTGFIPGKIKTFDIGAMNIVAAAG
jgi:hypothetical protein